MIKTIQIETWELALIIILLIVIAAIQIITVVFQQKIQEFFEKVRKNIKQKKTVQQVQYFISNLASTLARLSYDRVGAIIVIENRDSLYKYINSGKKVDIDFFPEFVFNIFYNHKSPLHDGAMIIRNLKICSLSSYLPLTNRVISVEYGARHRAAFGICEHYDCLSFVVSETTGKISFTFKNKTNVLSSEPSKLIVELSNIWKSRSIFEKSLAPKLII